jgi:AcrR family transcriptional regulator
MDAVGAGQAGSAGDAASGGAGDSPRGRARPARAGSAGAGSGGATSGGGTSGGAGSTGRAGYRRSAGSARGEARRRELLERVTDDLAANGLVDFSLRRAARAAGTTHKVLLYHFDSAEDLLRQAMFRLRARRIDNALAAMARGSGRATLADRVRAIWPALMSDASGLRVIDQAIGLVMYDPQRYADLGHEAAEQYLPALLSMCPPDWDERRKFEVAQMVLAVMRGFLMDWRASGEASRIEAGLEALVRALEREEAADR